MRYQIVMRALFAFCLFFVSHAGTEGFLAGTLVTTPRGLQAIEELRPGDVVCCCDGSGNPATSRIAAVRIRKASACSIACVAGEELAFLPSQKFYQPSAGRGAGAWRYVRQLIDDPWVPGHRLRPSLLVLSKLERPVVVDAVESFNLTDGTVLEFYALSLSEHHNYFVTHQELLVHNAFLAVIPVFTWVFGGGITFAKISAIAASVAVAFGMSKLDKELSKKGIDASMSYCGQQPVAAPQPEYVLQVHDIGGHQKSKNDEQLNKGNNGDDRPPRTPGEKEAAFKKLVDSRIAERKKTGSSDPVRAWNDAVYHNRNSTGSKSPPPQNGQLTTDRGLQFEVEKGKLSEHLVAREGKEFYVLRRTQSFKRDGVTVEEYHGYKESWHRLTDGMQKALIRAGEATAKGKAIVK